MNTRVDTPDRLVVLVRRTGMFQRISFRLEQRVQAAELAHQLRSEPDVIDARVELVRNPVEKRSIRLFL